jgi:hypothetical protein
VQNLQQELDAVRHHRTVLQDSVSQLESLVYRADEDTSSAPVNIYSRQSSAVSKYRKSPITFDGKDNSFSEAADSEALVRKITRQERKLAVADELVLIYRRGVQALYPDGSFYGSAQYTSVKHTREDAESERNSSVRTDRGAKSTPGSGGSGGWIDRELTLVKQSYTVEIEILEKEVDTLTGVARQQDSYCAELRIRLEDALRQMYRWTLSSKLSISLYSLFVCPCLSLPILVDFGILSYLFDCL